MFWRKRSFCRRHKHPTEWSHRNLSESGKNGIISLKSQTKKLKSTIRGNLPQSTLLARCIGLISYLIGFIISQMTILSHRPPPPPEREREESNRLVICIPSNPLLRTERSGYGAERSRSME